YLEQNAKDKYIKTIVSDIDDAPLITATTNKELRTNYELKKEKPKAAKDQLAQKYQDIRTLTPLVEQGVSIATSHGLYSDFPSIDCNRARSHNPITTDSRRPPSSNPSPSS